MDFDEVPERIRREVQEENERMWWETLEASWSGDICHNDDSDSDW